MTVSIAAAFDEGISAARRGWPGIVAYALAQWAGGGLLLLGAGLFLLVELGSRALLGGAKAAVESVFSAAGAAGLIAGLSFFAVLGVFFYIWLEISKTLYMVRIVRGEDVGWQDFFRAGAPRVWRSAALLSLTGLAAAAAVAACALPFLLIGLQGAFSRSVVLPLFLWSLASCSAAVYGGARLSLGLTALAAEDLRGGDALRAGWRASAGKFWKIFFLFLLYAFCVALIGLVLGTAALLLGKAGEAGRAGQALIQLLAAGLNYFSTFAVSGMLASVYGQLTADKGASL